MDYERTLYPPIEPYEAGMFEVGEGHSLYYERVGTPGAKPAVFLHGGPGGGMSPDHRRQWDPALYDVLLFDQRGCGKSIPFAGLDANDTWRIVEDVERLRQMCGHRAWQVFGGSWFARICARFFLGACCALRDSSSALPGSQDKAIRTPRVAVVTWVRINAVLRFGKCATRIRQCATGS